MADDGAQTPSVGGIKRKSVEAISPNGGDSSSMRRDSHTSQGESEAGASDIERLHLDLSQSETGFPEPVPKMDETDNGPETGIKDTSAAPQQETAIPLSVRPKTRPTAKPDIGSQECTARKNKDPRVADYIPPPTRCFNCQRFGHHKSQCQHETRCGVCSEKHETEVCITKHENNQPTIAKCPNCPADHHAWNKRCPAFINELNRRGTPAPSRTQINPSRPSFRLHPSQSYHPPQLRLQSYAEAAKPAIRPSGTEPPCTPPHQSPAPLSPASSDPTPSSSSQQVPPPEPDIDPSTSSCPSISAGSSGSTEPVPAVQHSASSSGSTEPVPAVQHSAGSLGSTGPLPAVQHSATTSPTPNHSANRLPNSRLSLEPSPTSPSQPSLLSCCSCIKKLQEITINLNSALHGAPGLSPDYTRIIANLIKDLTQYHGSLQQ
ncbi:arginine-glutamic acid dipeptide repeats protein-like [Palaemon carinicauda]|uniref:arginine-glutamic acid dipeptide repeats protein-like n=1 Tax=Palaemon carinicauda TaxID=392227 RepID=UPI0035B65E0F